MNVMIPGETFMLGVVQFSSPVIVENVPEYVRIAVEEILFRLLIVEEFALVGPQQSVRVLF